MRLHVRLLRDDETDQWGYDVPAMSIVGTGCTSRADAERQALAAIEFALENSGEPASEGETITYDVNLAPVRAP
jgi:hypothetical protein